MLGKEILSAIVRLYELDNLVENWGRGLLD
jgi:hypothetical protein